MLIIPVSHIFIDKKTSTSSIMYFNFKSETEYTSFSSSSDLKLSDFSELDLNAWIL